MRPVRLRIPEPLLTPLPPARRYDCPKGEWFGRLFLRRDLRLLSISRSAPRIFIKPNTMLKCFALVWGVIWLIIAFCFFAGGVLVGLACFKVCPVPAGLFSDCTHPSWSLSSLQQSAAQQKQDSSHFLPVPGSSGALQLLPTQYLLAASCSVYLFFFSIPLL